MVSLLLASAATLALAYVEMRRIFSASFAKRIQQADGNCPRVDAFLFFVLLIFTMMVKLPG